MKIFGIETSCDETAFSIVERNADDVSVLLHVVYSQVKEHAAFGGVVPEVAARLHLEKLFVLLNEEVGDAWQDCDAIAVTYGPGLAPALRIGVEFAKTLAWLSGKPLIPIDHMEGHLYANWIDRAPPALPALALLVSGGHTELILVKDHGVYERVGETLDDAAGEAFDKVASMLSLGYPGGPKVAALAEGGNKEAFDFPRGLLDRPNLDFSFSGLKTSVLYTLRQHEADLSKDGFKADIAASFQEAVVDVLVRKTLRALKQYDVRSVLLAGGVSANKQLRERLTTTVQEKVGIPVYVPELRYSMDNASMIATAGAFRFSEANEGVDPRTLKESPNLDIAV